MAERWRVVVVAAALLAAVFVSSPLHLPLNNPNEGVRVFTVKALVEEHTFAIDNVVKAWGFIDDKAIHNGHLYSSKAPLVSLVAAAGYAVVKPVTGPLDRSTLTRLCRLVGGVAPVAVLVALVWWALRRRHNTDADVVDLIVVAFVVGSGVLATLNVFSGHALAAGAALLAVALSQQTDVRTWHAIVVGAALSAATCAEYPAALSLPLALLLVARSANRARTVAVLLVVGFVVAIPTMLAHTAMFGAPHKTGYSFLESADYRPLVAGTFFGIGAPNPGVLATVLVSPELGLFFGSPVLVLGLVGVVARCRQGERFEAAVVVAVVVLYLLFIAGFRGWRGGWSVGPRYILELVGVLSPFVVDGARVLPARIRFAVVSALAAVGVLHSGLAGAFFPHLPEVFAAPVGSYVVPTVVRGFAPDSVPLALGAPASVAAAIVALTVFAVVVIVAVVWRKRGGAAVLVVVPLALLEVHVAPHTSATALEARRLADNWRPAAGNPYLVDLDSAPEATRFAVDRGRELRRAPLTCSGSPRPMRADIGAAAGIIEAAQHDVGNAARLLTIVDDDLADHIGPAGGAGVVLTFSDLKKRPGPLPCSGDILVVTRHPLPAMLAGLREADPAVDVGHGYRRHLRQRSTP